MSSMRLVVALLMVVGFTADAQRPSASAGRVVTGGDSLSALRIQYAERIRQLIPRMEAAREAARHTDSLQALELPADTLRVGILRFLIDPSQTGLMQDALSRAGKDLSEVFGTGTGQLDNVLFAARLRVSGRRTCTLCTQFDRDSVEKVIDLARVYPGRLDIFDRVQAEESAEVIAQRVATQGAKLLLHNADSALGLWLGGQITPGGVQKGVREVMYADLVTAPSQAASRCLAGDFRRCRDALGLIPTPDPLTEWYDASERRMLVLRMREALWRGPTAADYAKCVEKRDYAQCDRILRSVPGYVAPSPLPVSARRHLFRVALRAGGSDAWSRMTEGPARSVEERLSAGARMPIDSVVALWRADVVAARPPSPAPSLPAAWTTVAWGIAVMLVGLRFASWR